MEWSVFGLRPRRAGAYRHGSGSPIGTSSAFRELEAKSPLDMMNIDLGTCARLEKPPNQGLDLTNPDAAQSVASAPLCLLSGLAAQAHVGLSRKRRVPGAVRQSAAAVSKVGERAAMWPDSRGVCGLLGEQAFRCVGTTVRRDHDVLASTGCRVAVMRRGSGTLAPTVGVASAVRRDSAAPGLRYQRASTVTVTRAVRRKSGAPGLRCARTPVRRGQQSTGDGQRHPWFPRTAWNNERRRPPGFFGQVA